MSTKDAQMDPESFQTSIEACSGKVLKPDLKKGPSPGSGKVRSGYYLLHFSKVGNLKKIPCRVPHWKPFGKQIP